MDELVLEPPRIRIGAISSDSEVNLASKYSMEGVPRSRIALP